MKKVILTVLTVLLLFTAATAVACAPDTKTHTVTFDLNGGTLISGSLVQTIADGGSAVAPKIEKREEVGQFRTDPLYVRSDFMGWYKSLNDEQPYDLGSVDSNITLYAKWKRQVFSYVKIEDERVEPKEYIFIYEPVDEDMTELVIPDEIDGLPVTSVNAVLFSGLENLKSIVIGDNVKLIGMQDFIGNPILESVHFGRAMNSLSSYSFTRCPSLTELTVSEENETYYSAGNCIIEKQTKTLVMGCAVSEIPEGVEGIGSHAFGYRGTPKKLVIPSGVKNIYSYAFNGCDMLESIEISENVTGVRASAFFNCSGLKEIIVSPNNRNYYVSDNCLIERMPVEYDDEGNYIRTEYTLILGLNDGKIPKGVQTIASYAFAENSKITSITLPDTVTTVNTSAFLGCPNLASVHLGNGIQELGDDAFSECPNIKSFTVAEGNAKYYAAGNCLIEKDVPVYDENDIDNDKDYDEILRYEDTLVFGCSASVIPSGVEAIGAYALSRIAGLNVVVIPESVKYIYTGAFEGCPDLKSVTLPEGLIGLGRHVFSECAALESLTIPDGVENLDRGLISYCSSLNSLHIGKGVKTIHKSFYLLYEGSALEAITVDKDNPVFYAKNNCLVERNKGIVDDSDIDNDGDYDEILRCEDTLILAGNNETVEIPEGVVGVAGSAFNELYALKHIIIPASLTNIVDGAFNGCKNLQSFTVQEGNQNICVGKNGLIDNKRPVYDEIGNLIETQKTLLFGFGGTHVVVDDEIDSIAASAFEGKENIESVIISDGIKYIGAGAFISCRNLKKIVFGESVVEIGDMVLYGCGNSVDIYFVAETLPTTLSEGRFWNPHAYPVYLGYTGEDAA